MCGHVERVEVEVEVVALHLICELCTETVRIEHQHPDGFTRYVLQPAVAWWTAHLAPRLVKVEVRRDGVVEFLAAV